MARAAKQAPEIDIPTWLRGLPKAELHLHLEGTILPETLVTLSHRNDPTPLTLEAAQQLYLYTDFPSFLMSFKAVTERLHTPADYELITYDMVRTLAYQGVLHAEVYISYGILYRYGRLDIDDVTAAIERGRLRAENEFGTTVLWIIDAVRHFGAEEAAVVFRKAATMRQQYPSIIGIGIGGDEARGPADQFRDLYAEARAAGLRLTAHAGESTGPESIWSAVNLGAERIGHALSAQHDPELLEILAQRQIPLEINVTSNLRTGCCPTLDAHPLKDYFESGLMVTLNSDDPPMFGSNLLEEYLLAYETYGFTLEQMRELAANSIEASFLPPDRKLALLRQVDLYGW
ncbi:adenosine deaminase [Granulicella arctica]|uniref:Adenosine deaminase/aminodeoxyfutalosine deaminase n=1 Tax=Granulicella arctica TaxID=940613 RepID=A0A7Y9PFT2_9BACT|nr:adenosine deaminase [Granulicella arctica]NYF79096.1 adenosine deaminase/aminodeoxyfutalosine deaminase [Granulicella arctica]